MSSGLSQSYSACLSAKLTNTAKNSQNKAFCEDLSLVFVCEYSASNFLRCQTIFGTKNEISQYFFFDHH